MGKREKLETEMKRSQLLSLRSEHRTLVKAVSGELWVSVEGQGEDYIVACGEELSVRPSGRMVVQALRDSRVQLRFA